MAKVKSICPFSGRRCVGCPLFRGRHCGMGFSKLYHEHTEMEVLRSQRRATESGNGDFGMPDTIPVCSSWISDVEELIESREG